ncbi:MAG: tetratricopeptide repeat protein, partial [Bacteroidales bacterium]|nr:tetratricopeptide repeat protein [Bacteroidales bacterium]
MALIKCIECGQMMSDRAEACPNCGARPGIQNQTVTPQLQPIRDKRKSGKSKGVLISVIVFVLALLSTIGYLFANDSKWTKPHFYSSLIEAYRGDPYYQYYLGDWYWEEEDYGNAVKWFAKSAAQGYSDAQFFLGVCYENGLGVSQDFEQAARLYRESAEQGDNYAKWKLGQACLYGAGVPKNAELAFQLFHEAAIEGIAPAIAELGICFEKGLGTSQDIDKAISLYQQAAEQGSQNGNVYLANCYWDGIGVAQDYNEAVRLYREAA